MCDHCGIRLRHHDAASDAEACARVALRCADEIGAPSIGVAIDVGIETGDLGALPESIPAEDSAVLFLSGADVALAVPGTDLRLFGKPRVEGKRRVAVALASAPDVEQARAKARAVAAALDVTLA